MVNLLPGPTRDAMTLAKRAVTALEDIAKHLTRMAHEPAQAPPVNGWLPVMNPEVGVHSKLGCEMVFTSSTGNGCDTVWCNTHDVELPLVLEPVVPPLNDADLAALRAKLEGRTADDMKAAGPW